MSNWINEDLDISNILKRFPQMHLDLISEIEAAAKAKDYFAYMDRIDDLEIWCKWLVMDQVITKEEWDFVLAKYPIPMDE